MILVILLEREGIYLENKNNVTKSDTQQAKNNRNWRIYTSLLLIAFSIGFPMLLGLFLAVIVGSNNFSYSVGMCYMLFGAGATIGGILGIVFPAMYEKDVCLGFGYAILYGTSFTAVKILPYFGCEEGDGTILLAAVIVSLIAYIVWIKKFKN